MATKEYSIVKLDRIRVILTGRETIGYLKGNYYYELHNGEGNEKIHRAEKVQKVESFTKTAANNNLFVKLLDGKGRFTIDLKSEKVFELFLLAQKIEGLSETDTERLNIIAKTVAQISSQKLEIPHDKKEEFEDLLKNFIVIELLSGNSDVPLYAGKTEGYLDYKTNRIVNYLNINLDLDGLEDFYLEYTNNGVVLDKNEVLNLEDKKPEETERVYVRK